MALNLINQLANSGIEVLIQLAGLLNQPVQFKPTTTACEALKCIANCIYLKEETKVYLEQANTISACQFVLQSENQLGMDFQFLLCRILFFMTVNRHDIVEQLVRSNISQSIEKVKVLLDNIVQLENPVSRQAIDQRDPINAFTVTSEALKLLFNLMLVKARKSNNATIDDSTASDGFKNCLVPIFHLLFGVPYAERQPLVPPHSQAIHALMQFPYTTIEQVWQSQAEWTSQLYDKKDDEHGYKFIATTFVDILDRAIHALIPQGDPDHDDVQQVDSIIAPLLLVLVSLAEGNSVLKSIMARSMLPGDK
ncbi:MAG: guanine nucleotide exchange factor [Benjaminiella poitrasii]|nr:MAG: guanine nucleotide exchange factor [Benjaminiella poitrasii]